MLKNTFRNRRFLDLAHGIHDCQLRIPGVCVGYSVDGCEPAHGNWAWVGKGMGMKAEDVFVASCHACHVELDQGSKLSGTERELYWCRGAVRTWLLLMREGRIRLA
jgi:hypothetical protein